MATIAPTPKIVSVSKYIQEIADLDRSGDQHYVFRGQPKYAWKFQPGVLRAEQKKLLAHENDAIREIISVHPTEFSDDQTMFDRLVRAQHYGLPTRLLDVSVNPLIALYFATEEIGEIVDGRIFTLNVPPSRRKYYDSDAVSCIANLANLSNVEKEDIGSLDHTKRSDFNCNNSTKRLVQFVRAEKPYFQRNINPIDLFRPYHVIPKLSNKRIIAQSGSFIIYGLNGGPSFNRNIKVKSIRIPHASKATIRTELRQLGVHQATLFPEIEKAAGYIKQKYA